MCYPYQGVFAFAEEETIFIFNSRECMKTGIYEQTINLDKKYFKEEGHIVRILIQHKIFFVFNETK